MKTRWLVAAVLLLGIVFAAVQLWPSLTGPPELTTWRGEADEILIERPSGTLHFVRRGEGWVALPSDQALDTEEVERLLGALRRTEITDRITDDSKSDAAYGLSDDEAVRVVVRQGETVLRELIVGQPNRSTYAHTFVKLPDHEEVFLASGRLDSPIGRSLQRFRKRQVISLSPGDVTSFSVKHPGGEYALQRSEDAWTLAEHPDWELNSVFVEGLLSTFAPLELLEYREDLSKEGLGEPRAELRVGTKDGEVVLRIHRKAQVGTSGVGYLAATSDGPEVFVLSQSSVERFFRPAASFRALGPPPHAVDIDRDGGGAAGEPSEEGPAGDTPTEAPTPEQPATQP